MPSASLFIVSTSVVEYSMQIQFCVNVLLFVLQTFSNINSMPPVIFVSNIVLPLFSHKIQQIAVMLHVLLPAMASSDFLPLGLAKATALIHILLIGIVISAL